ncbi:MAG: DNA primase [Verrucomicrobiales bacterium]
MARISEETKQRVIEANDIVEIIGGYFPLKRAGTNFRALCPFHNEKSPSFNVNPMRGIYHCFGCHAGGDVIKFVMEYEHLSFTDAVKKLAERAGIAIEEAAFDPDEDRKRRMRSNLLALQRKAAEWFAHRLFRNADAEIARDYLKNRGINGEIAKRWGIGYAPESSRDFLNWARQEQYSARLLVDSGLAAWSDADRPERGVYARFRKRLMFPIANDYGEIIAFSGRILDPAQQGGKYVNSPETPVFTKSKTFFGLDKTKRSILHEGRVLLCEGQMDLITCFEAGVQNMVAPLGTAFTEDHARLLKRLTEEAVLVFDSDTAGQKAAVRTFELLASAGILVRIAELPPGEDPDSLVRNAGPEALRELVANAPEFFDFQIDQRSRTVDLTSLRERHQFAKDLSALVARVKEKMLQDSLILRVSTRLGVAETEIRQHVAEAKRGLDRSDKATARRDKALTKDDGARNSATVSNARPVTIRNRTIRYLCQILLTDAAARDRLCSQPPPDFLEQVPETEVLVKLWQARINPGQASSVPAFLSTLDDNERSSLTLLLSQELPEGAGDEAELMLADLGREALQNRKRELTARLKDPAISQIEAQRLTKELLDLQNRLRHVPPAS